MCARPLLRTHRQWQWMLHHIRVLLSAYAARLHPRSFDSFARSTLGKTSLIKQLVSKKFEEDYCPTISEEFVMDFSNDGKDYELHVSDSMGVVCASHMISSASYLINSTTERFAQHPAQVLNLRWLDHCFFARYASQASSSVLLCFDAQHFFFFFCSFEVVRGVYEKLLQNNSNVFASHHDCHKGYFDII